MPDELKNALNGMCGDIVELRKGDHTAERLQIERERLELEKEKAEKWTDEKLEELLKQPRRSSVSVAKVSVRKNARGEYARYSDCRHSEKTDSRLRRSPKLKWPRNCFEPGTSVGATEIVMEEKWSQSSLLTHVDG